MNETTTAGRTHPGDGDWARSRLPDAEIIRRVLAGNDAAFEGIMRRYNRLLFRIARGMVGRDDEAQDIVQESYVRAYFRLAQFEGPDGFTSWLSRIVINEALARVRKRGLAIDEHRTADELPAANRDRPEEIAMGKDTMAMIESAIDALPRDFRIVFMMRAVEGLSVAETAELLDIKAATVKTRYFRAKAQISKTLTRRIEDAVPASFSFDGPRCDGIVHDVFAAIAGRKRT